MKNIIFLNHKFIYVLSFHILFILFALDTNVLNAQIAVKSSFTFPSTLYPHSEDWPLTLIQADDCLHQFFGGYVACATTTCGSTFRIPILGKINPLTKSLVWEQDYSVAMNNNKTSSYGSYNAIYELDGFLWAVGAEHETPYDFSTWRAVINKVSIEDGTPESGYPKFLDLPNAGNDNQRAFDMQPVYKNSVFDGFIVAGTVDYLQSDAKAMIVKLTPDGELDTDFSSDGIYLSDEEGSLARTVIRVENSTHIFYAFAGEILESGAGSPIYKSDAYFEGISETGDNIWKRRVSEADPGTSYTDVDSPELIDCDGQTDIRDTEAGDNERGYCIIQDGASLIATCTFDYIKFNPQSDFCDYFQDFEQYLDVDIALLKLDHETGNVEGAANISRFSGDDFYPIVEKKNNAYYVLGSKTYVANGVGGSNTNLVKVNQDLEVIWERQFNTNGVVNCAFDISFDCDDDIIIAGNNEHDEEDNYFYRLGSECQINSSFDIVNNLDVTGTTTWNSSRKVNATIRVKSGGTLVINSGAVIQFGASWDLIDYNVLSQNSSSTKVPRIIVESGGELTLDNCTLKGLSACTNNSMWDGVEVQNGGNVNLSNDAIIMDAKYGILADMGSYNSNGHFNPTESSGGGIIQSNGATITNCRRGIHFANCASNSSSISSTTFSCTGYLKDPSYKTFIQDISNPDGVVARLGTSIFVSSNDASGMNFTGCDWSNSASLSPYMRGIGINSFNAGYNLNGGSTMSGLNIGIQADNTKTMKFIYVSGSNQFLGNQTGILLRAGNFHKIVGQNNFLTKFSPFSPISFYQGAGVGIYIGGSNKILIEKNTFTAGASTVSNTGTYGIISENTGSAASLHKLNEFTNVEFGDQTQRNNGGLNLWCNDHTQNRKAWSINPQTSGAFSDQGQCNQLFGLTPENNFIDATCQTPLNHIHSTVAFDYWINSSEPDPPTCNSTIVETPNCIPSSLISGCDASIQLTPGNVVSYFNEVPYISDETERELLVNELIRYYIMAEEVDTVLILLSNESNENYKMAYALLLLELGEVSQAQDVVETLSTSSGETESFTDYFNVLVYAHNNELGLFELPTEHISELEDIAENRTFGGYSAQVILANYYGKEYSSILETEEGIEYRSKKEDKIKANITKNYVHLTPNPASDLITIKYEIMENTPFDFEIQSVEGKTYFQKSTLDKSGQLSFYLETLPKGVYMLIIRNQEKNLSGKHFIKN